MSIEQLAETARAMVAPGKGIIAIDESNATIKKRFDGVGIENTEENRRAYRELLLGTPNLSQYISGAILFDETIRQSTKDGVPFTRLMMDNGIIPGIKVDKGPQPLAGFGGGAARGAPRARRTGALHASRRTGFRSDRARPAPRGGSPGTDLAGPL